MFRRQSQNCLWRANLVLSLGVRGEKLIVPATTILGVLDHDVNSKGSLMLSVCIKVKISEEYDTFHCGDICVTLKDAVLQALSAFCYAAEIKDNLKENLMLLLMIYSDGGSNQHLTYKSVLLSLIARRTAPGHCWVNPVEHINLAYQIQKNY